MDTRHPLDQRAVLIMLALCMIWSLQQIGLKATAADFSPVLQIGLRSGISAILVGIYLAARGQRIAFSSADWKPGLMAGFLFGLEFLLVGEGLHFTSAAHMAVFLYTAPIFAALGLQWKLPSERLTALQWVGIGLAFCGIAAAFLLRKAQSAGSNMLWGDFLGLLGGMAWGATTVVIRTTRLAALPAGQTLLYQLVGAFVLLVPAAVMLGHTTINPTPLVLANFAFQAVVVSFISFLVWFWLLRNYLASRLGVFSFLTPLFGVLLGALLLGEAIELGFVLGALLVLTGVVLVNGHEWVASLWAK